MSPRPAVPPPGVPGRITFQGMFWSFDCIAGNGDAIYYVENDKGERRHAVVPKRERARAAA